MRRRQAPHHDITGTANSARVRRARRAFGAPRFAPLGRLGCRTVTALSTWPRPSVSRTASPVKAALFNAMEYLVSTCILPPWSAPPDHGPGGTGGGTGPRAGCSPLRRRVPILGATDCDGSSDFREGVNSLRATGLRRLRSGGALCRPRCLPGTHPELKGSRGVSDPEIWPHWRSRPRPAKGRSRHGVPVSAGLSGCHFVGWFAARTCGRSRWCFLRAVGFHSAVRIRAPKALRGAAPALRAAAALTARSANRIPAFTDVPGTCPAGARPTPSAARRSWFARVFRHTSWFRSRDNTSANQTIEPGWVVAPGHT